MFIYNRKIGQIVPGFKKELEDSDIPASQTDIQTAGKNSRGIIP
jgi:hypothetical protein